MSLPDQSISVCIPTRGDVILLPLQKHLLIFREIDDVQIIIGDTPHNRYRAAAKARHDWIYTQDDDCVTDLNPLFAMWETVQAEVIEKCRMVNAMTPRHAAQYPGEQTLIGFGAIFHRLWLRVFDGFELDDLFWRESDRIFGTLVPHITIFPQIEIMPWANAPNRLWMQREHMATRLAMEKRIEEHRAKRI